MWDNWKKKIENFIWKEVEVEEDIQEFQPLQELHPDIKARMLYQYPKNESYHIPQIQDQNRKISRPNVDIETPAYLRKGHRLSSISPINQVNHNSSRSKPIHQNKQKKQDVSKAETLPTTKKPFERTDVPSPIYGFNSRKQQKEVVSVPTYIRKQKVKYQENVEPVVDQNQTVDISTVQTETSNLVNEQLYQNNRPSRKMEEFKSVEKKEQPISQSQQVLQVEKDSKPKRTGSDDKKQASIPYNVMMTPQDKRKISQRYSEPQLENQRYSNSRQAEWKHKENKEIKERQIEPEQPIEVNQISTIKAEHTTIPLHLLNDPIVKSNLNDQWILEQQELLEQTLKHFHVRARVVNATQGPAVTRFEVHPELGVKVSKVKNLSDDLKLNMSAKDIRIEAPIPGKNTIGIEVPNPSSQMVGLQEILGSDSFTDSNSPLTIALGLNIEGAPVVTNIQKMPHGLIAGATGSGKSVCINTILLSLIYKSHHEDVKFMLIDPKMVELAPYNGIPHLVSPVITDVKAATAALKWAVNEMEERYEKFVHEGVRDIERYNQRVLNQNRANEKMPFIVIVIDELADLMMVSPQDVEDAISRIAQKARACGIHLLLATQRPSVDVLTGLIKANIPTRISFSVSSQVDSRTIIDTGGAEKLLGKGDMLFVENGAGKTVRLQGPFVSDEEIERITSYVRTIAEPNYLFEQESLLKQFVADEEEDELLTEAIEFIFEQDSASTSLLQRHFKIGYNRAARLMDALEVKGIISGQNGSKPRDVLITRVELEEILS
ncbi:DNA translocase FtsK [Paucisalibacillus sp. EB02]|uniref:DNA translocase FtsK n=1 Tax=Paucisalibacillus sp. EB02 TaxID=1347087 RepID=UPI0004B30438|nr:DNA translocase FtsK [Paucisalibacillus sp. EB02]